MKCIVLADVSIPIIKKHTAWKAKVLNSSGDIVWSKLSGSYSGFKNGSGQ